MGKNRISKPQHTKNPNTYRRNTKYPHPDIAGNQKPEHYIGYKSPELFKVGTRLSRIYRSNIRRPTKKIHRHISSTISPSEHDATTPIAPSCRRQRSPRPRHRRTLSCYPNLVVEWPRPLGSIFLDVTTTRSSTTSSDDDVTRHVTPNSC